ncbi:hypothetical protein OQJ18_02565 [Fluoribacter dumoffii]|uniref:hypothetical protein n=1 Tax=Fluoribacter dumoffii TaxID=463 RepID=UPI0022433F7A|nr:hypothetical protein [Fluoribacter dumoffii]MCW8419028.1 hypothetical protein [Fluoribacter dumoffii]MCW8453128.1 hypothetical protein [Fluoribacter dumoffii]MCW8459654.1 hypothetical protein [Fluoribacter dumoffii]MCW8483011.1 hypothetical protein [Fluoribacter dumoffii]
MKHDKSIVPSSIKDAALLAKSYAREFIVEGGTQLINNTYPEDKKKSLSEALKSIREKSQEPAHSWLEFDYYIYEFYQSITCSKKYSIGNCNELAELALDYIAHFVPHIDAEVFQLLGGNHVVLVVGREKGSDPRKPETWGKTAYICDPWSDEVYPASEYLSRTKNYYQEYDKALDVFTNHVEDFNPSKHTFSPIRNYTTDYIRKYNTTEHIVKVHELFQKKQQILIAAAVNLEKALIHLSDKLEKKFGPSNEKYKIIQNKIVQLKSATEEITRDFITPVDETSNYYDIISQLDKTLRKSVKTFVQAAAITKEEATTLAKPVEISWRHKFFPQYDVISKINEALKASDDSIKNIIAKK